MAGFGGGLAGLGPNFRPFEAAGWVDQKKNPGHTSTEPRCGQPGWWYSGFPNYGVFGLGLPFVYSPNLVWFAISLATYLLFPYDYHAAKVWERDYVLQRLAVNFALGLGYIGWWHVSLYTLRWGERKLNPDGDGPNLARLIHNIWYTLLGIAQWTAWELVIVHLFATGKVAYTSDSELLGSPRALLLSTVCILGLPVLRDFHFYFAHRILHIRPLYFYVHSLHHRNNDPEPFAGMCMHPIEHLYYFSCATISIYICASPLLLTFNLAHAALAPAAGHSGFEDHWQSDQFHHLHHTYFECNYGNTGFPFDKWFGTARHSILDRKVLSNGESSAGRGEAQGEEKQKQKDEQSRGSRSQSPARFKAKATKSTYLTGGVSFAWAFPTKPDHAVYWCFTASVGVALYCALHELHGMDRVSPQAMAALVSFGPIAFAYVLHVATGDKRSARWPFQKDSVWGSFGWHLLMASATVVLPTFHCVLLLLQ